MAPRCPHIDHQGLRRALEVLYPEYVGVVEVLDACGFCGILTELHVAIGGYRRPEREAEF